MSTTNVHALHDAVGHGEYIELGRDEKRASHIAAGTNRLAAMRSSLGSVSEFTRHARMTARRFARTVEAQSYTQSFHPDTFDVTNPEHIKQVNELGCELAERMHPNSHYVVVTHVDAAGRNLHNHIDVENHDTETGRALSRYRTHREVKWANDQLMREHGLPVIEPSPDERRLTQADYWAKRRGQLLDGQESFDVWLGDQIEEAMLAPDVWDVADLGRELAARNITMTTRKAGRNTQPGITYSAVDEIGPKRRTRRRKASKLSGEFTSEGLKEFFALKDKEIGHERQGPIEPKNPQLDADAVVTYEPDFAFDLSGLEPAVRGDERAGEQRDIGEDSQHSRGGRQQSSKAAREAGGADNRDRKSDQSPESGRSDVDLAAVRAGLAAARERDERIRRDEEAADRDRLDAERVASREAQRRLNRENERLGRAEADEAARQADDGLGLD